MSDLADFLLARIAEDEAAARAAILPIYGQTGEWRTFDDKEHLSKTAVFASNGGDRLGQACDTAMSWIGRGARDHIARWDPARVLAECDAKRRIVERETATVELPEWTPDCGGDWCLNVGALSHEPGVGAFANYWPDNTVSASVYVDGKDVAKSGIVAHASKAECQAFAEHWIRDHLADASPVLRLLALPNADHPDYREEWRP